LHPSNISISSKLEPLPKAPTGIVGFDDLTHGGLPRGRPTIITGTAGCGKTLFGIEFVVRGALQFDEPGVFMAFEENAEELTQNVRSLGYDLDALVAGGLLVLDHVRVERSEIEETGEYDLDGLFIRLGYAIDSVGAKRVVLDTIEALFAGFTDHGILRAELRRLFRWLKEKGVTAIITAERGTGTLTRHGLEEYVSDCVILLDHRVSEQIPTRRLRIVKYRGSTHGTNEYPFLIDNDGITILPITSLGLNHVALKEHVSTGIPRLDTMLGGLGYFRGSSVLISGTAGAGKSSMAAHFADAAARRGERCLYLALEESEQQIVRNMHSIGLDLQQWTEQGLLRFHAMRPSLQGLEMHLVVIHKLIREFQPQVMIIDPISNLVEVGHATEVKAALTRLIDLLKSNQITGLFANLTSQHGPLENTDIGISSLMDCWILLKMIESNGERNRGLYVLKARGMEHSNQIREFQMTDQGIQLLDVYVGTGGVLTGSARLAQEAEERTAALLRQQEIEAKQRELERKRQHLEVQIAALRNEFTDEEEALDRAIRHVKLVEHIWQDSRKAMAQRRGSDDLYSASGHDQDRDQGEFHGNSF
jgi:circadian clock protein KaiC